MAILQSCCCWRSLRKGAYASAAYTMVYYIITVIIMGSFVEEERHYWSGNSSRPKSISFLEPETISPTTMVFNIVVLSCATVGVFASLILICGLYSDNKFLLIPWIFTVIATLFIDISHSIYLFVLETMEFNPMTAILFTLDFFVLCLTVYCLLCVVSQYQEYKAGRGTADFESINRRVPGVRYAPQPTGTSFLSTRRAVTYHETRASPTGSPPTLDKTARKHVQFGDEDRTRLAPPMPSIIRIDSPKDSVSSEFNCRSGGTPSEEGNSMSDWTTGANGKPTVDTVPLITTANLTLLPAQNLQSRVNAL